MVENLINQKLWNLSDTITLNVAGNETMHTALLVFKVVHILLWLSVEYGYNLVLPFNNPCYKILNLHSNLFHAVKPFFW